MKTSEIQQHRKLPAEAKETNRPRYAVCSSVNHMERREKPFFMDLLNLYSEAHRLKM